MGQAEAARQELRLEIEVTRECDDEEIEPPRSARKIVFWRDDERVVVFEPPRRIDIANGESPTQAYCSTISRREAISTYACNPITFSDHGHIGCVPEQNIVIAPLPELVEEVD
jgi:hypothetical protein